MERSSGILLHISSLPGPFGIGTLGQEAYDFVDQIEAAGLSYWQTLPLTPPGYSNSPYSSTSCFASNICFIDPREMQKDGYFTKAEVKKYYYPEADTKQTDYAFANKNVREFLELAYERIDKEQEEELEAFIKENAYWLHDYAVYEVLHTRFDGQTWQEWPEAARDRDKSFITKFLNDEDNRKSLNLVYFAQWQFRLQWDRLRDYAAEHHIEFIGDMPIFPALDSADVWANPDLFQLDEDGYPIFKAGVPPDYFSEDGQLWGNPLYDWQAIKNTGYSWWIDRVRHTMYMFDVVRIDHFRGFSSYWAVPGDEETARNGVWVKGPGMDLFNKLHAEIDDLRIIAEDLGDIDSDVVQLLEDSGYPGMKIMLFSFDNKESSGDLPYQYDHNKVVYTGTHDNDTVYGWLARQDKDVRDYALEYTRLDKNIDWRLKGPYSPSVRSFIVETFATNADLAVIPIQDFLGMGNERRMNVPGTVNEFNWSFRLERAELEELDIEWIHKINKLYQRLVRHEEEFTEEEIEEEDAEEAEKELAEEANIPLDKYADSISQSELKHLYKNNSLKDNAKVKSKKVSKKTTVKKNKKDK